MKPKQKDEQSLTAGHILSMHILAVLTIAAHILAFWLSTKGSLFPGYDALMNIIGTCAEIIAGLYGITMASYTFFLSRIDALMAQDMTLDHIVRSLKGRFKKLLWYITGNVMATLFITVFLMYYPAPSQEEHIFFYRLFCNEFVLSLGFSTVLILYYAILVIDPNCLEKEARRMKKRISRAIVANGSVIDFISNYDRIERVCNSLIPEPVLSQLQENKGKRFEYTIELLMRMDPSLLPLLHDLNRIHKYYECMVNCTPMTVTKEMTDLSGRVLAYLEQHTK